jgi:hypothetical protein
LSLHSSTMLSYSHFPLPNTLGFCRHEICNGS